jgi:3-hydroxyisobutyrate dehydrogenase-like beta-hydroxyacid dehydrogenase
MTTIGLAGLGLMGTAIAERLLEAGHELAVHNRTRARAHEFAARNGPRVTVVDSPEELLGRASVCVTMLSDDAALEAVAGGVLAGGRPEATLIDMSTVSVGGSRRVAEASDAAGVAFLRAPASGNPVAVRAGNLAIVVSGPRDRYEALAPILQAIGPHVHYVGPAEEARVVKLALQVMIAGTAELIAEAVLFGERQGVDPAALLDVMAGSAVGSPFLKYKKDPLLSGDYSATFTTGMMAKDLELIRAAAAEAGVTLPLADRVGELLQRTIAAGHRNADFMALLPALREENS